MTNIILTVLLAVTMLAVFYRYAIRRLFQDAFFDRIQKHEESLQELAEHGATSASDPSFVFLKKQFQVRYGLLNLSVSSFLHFLFCEKEPEQSAADLEEFRKNASPELKQLYSEFCKDTISWMLLSSPVYSLLGCAIIITSIFLFGKKEEKEVKVKACEYFYCGSQVNPA